MGKVVMGEVVTGQVVTGQVVTGQMVTGQVVMGQVVMGQVVMGQVVMGQVVMGQVVTGQQYWGWEGGSISADCCHAIEENEKKTSFSLISLYSRPFSQLGSVRKGGGWVRLFVYVCVWKCVKILGDTKTAPCCGHL
jgi:hypothetical protein